MARPQTQTTGATSLDLPLTLNGQIGFDPSTRAVASDDFGHLVHDEPRAVVRAASAADVVAAVNWAAKMGVTVAPRGQGHSVWGRSQADDGVVVDMSRLGSVERVDHDRVVVGAGATWSHVLATTLPYGRTPPVLVNHLPISVGGTLAVGGIGSTTFRCGAQSDQVIEMDVVTGRGQRLACSATSNLDLFDAVRAGLGQVGIVTRATLRLVAAPARVRRYLLSYPTLADMVRDARVLARDERFDALEGAIVPASEQGWFFQLDAVKHLDDGDTAGDHTLLDGLGDDPDRRKVATEDFVDYVNRLAPLERVLRANGQWLFPHPWLCTFLGDSAVEPVVDDELARLVPQTDLGQFGQVVLTPMRRSAVDSPLLRLPEDDLCFAFNLIRIPTTADGARAKQLVDANVAIYRRVKEAGGTLYPVSALSLSSREWRDHYGTVFARFEQAKRMFDPDNLLTPTYEVFRERKAQ